MIESYPTALNIFLTKRCNLACRYCFVDKGNSNCKEIDIFSLKKAIDIFLKFPTNDKTISFSGGEPLLRFKKIREICAYLEHRKGSGAQLTAAITTNGTLLTRDRFQFFKKHKVILKVSIDGTKKIHDYNHPFKSKKYGSSYNRIIDNLKKIHGSNNGYKINAQLVFTSFTLDRKFDNIVSLWKRGFSCIDFFPELYARWSESELAKMEMEFRKFSDFYISIFKKGKDEGDIFENSLLHAFVKRTELYRPIRCQKIHLDWRGNFYCCDKVFSIPESERKKFIIGNIYKGINNRLRLRLLERKRREIKSLTGKDCHSCQYLKYCFCPIGQYIYFSHYGLNFREYLPQFCRISQIYIANFLRIITCLKDNPLFVKVYLENVQKAN